MNELETYSLMLNHSLKVNTVICPVCGCIVAAGSQTKACEHLRDLALTWQTDTESNVAISKFDIIVN